MLPTSKRPRMAYVETPLFSHLKAELRQSNSSYFPFFIVGAKGVGKSSLLNALHEEFKNMEEYDSVSFHESPCEITPEAYKTFDKDFREDKKSILFIDNVQMLPPKDTESYRILRHLVKNKIWNKDWQMVLSTSQQGLGKVVAELKLGPNNVVSTFCVNPEKEVAQEIFDRLLQKPNDANKDALLDYVGYVPLDVLLYFEYGLPLDKFKETKKSIVMRALGLEEQELLETWAVKARLKALAIICKKEDIYLNEFNWGPESLQWTYLKSKETTNVYEVSCVSPAMWEATVKYMNTNPPSLMEMVKEVNILTCNKPGNWLGKMFQSRVFAELKTRSDLLFWVYSNDNVETCKLFVAGYTSKECTKQSITKYMEENPNIGKGVIINFPNASHYDIVIIDSSGELHGIQVTTMSRVAKCSSGEPPFHADASCKFKYIITPETEKPSPRARASKFVEAFKSHNLRVLDPLDLLGEDLPHFRCYGDV